MKLGVKLVIFSLETVTMQCIGESGPLFNNRLDKMKNASPCCSTD